MDPITVLVVANPADKQMGMLNALDASTSKIAIGDDPDSFTKLAPQADVLFNWSGKRALLRQIWHMAPKLRWVHSRSAGLDSMLFPELVESPVPLTNGRGVFSQSLGEFVLGGVLYFAKDFARMRRSQREGKWDPFDTIEISTQTLGIVGYGDIGKAVARRAKAMDMKILALRRNPDRSEGDELVSKVYGWARKLEMIAECDYVVVAAPLTPQTHHMISDAEFTAMKPTAVIINVGRGPVIDEAAMVRALESGRIKGAALDVFEVEPLPAESPLYKLDNVLLSPHSADNTPDWLENAMTFFMQNLERFRKGEPLLNVVDKRSGY